ncbi:MAG: 30S ribosomal protein S8, partial [Anaerolineales bacterium]
MSVSDPIADMLTRIRNGLSVRKRNVIIPSSKLKLELARVLKAEGFIDHFDVTKDRPQPMLRVHLKYSEGSEAVITGL